MDRHDAMPAGICARTKIPCLEFDGMSKARQTISEHFRISIHSGDSLKDWAKFSVLIYGAMPRILIIDDNEDLRELMREVLERDGAEVFEAEDGVAGLDIFKTCRPDLLIVDIVMPEKDGMQLLTELQKEVHEAKIIVISGGGGDDSIETAMDLGADQILFKPFRNHELVEIVHEVLHLDRAIDGAES